MSYNIRNFLKVARAACGVRVLFLCALLLCVCADSFAQQSGRRKIYGRVAPSPTLKILADENPEIDIDMFAGRIVRKDGDYVIVYIMSPTRVSGRVPVYYGCDEKMRPTSILSNTGVAHRSCATFKVESGEARVGDSVMVKYLAPKKSG